MTSPVSRLRGAGLLMVLGLNLWLVTKIALEIMSDHSAAAKKVDWNVDVPASLGDIPHRKPIDAYGQILTRPIFFRSREPFVPTVTPPSAALIASPPQLAVDPGLVLGGVMIYSDVRKAYVFSKANAAGTWTNEGDEFMGWRIRSIDGTGAKLEQKGRSLELQLYPLK